MSKLGAHGGGGQGAPRERESVVLKVGDPREGSQLAFSFM